MRLTPPAVVLAILTAGAPAQLPAGNGSDERAWAGRAGDPPEAAVEPGAIAFPLEPGGTASAALTLSNVAPPGAADLEFEVSVAFARPEGRLVSPDGYAPRVPAAGLDPRVGSGAPGPFVRLEGPPFRTDRGRNQITFTHSASPIIPQTPQAIGCAHWDATPPFARANQYWRVFELSDFGIAGELEVTSLDVGVWMNHDTNPPLTTVRLHTLDGPLHTEKLTFVAETELQITPGHHLSLATATFTPGATFAADDVLVVEWSIPDAQAGAPFEGHHTLAGQNAAGETAPTYLSAEACEFLQPVTLASIGFPDRHWVLLVHGTISPAIITVDPASGTVPAGEALELLVTAEATGLEAGIYDFEVLIATNDPQNPVLTVDVTVEVAPVMTEGTAAPVVEVVRTYPNPFTTRATIEYVLATAAPVEVTVFDLTGRRVATLVDAEQAAGGHAATWDAEGAAAGVYVLLVRAGAYTVARRAVLIR